MSQLRRYVWLPGMALLLAACTPNGTVVQPTSSPSEPARSTASGPPASAVAEPPACLDAKLVWADALDRLLLTNCFDQMDSSSVETVWAWTGSAWELLADDGPPAHVVTGMGWDPDRDVLIRYGGIPVTAQECSTATWEWDASAWREVAVDAPEICDHAELAWDASAGRMLLAGGGRGPNPLPGTWAWDGAAWSELTGDGPAPRGHHGLVTDEAGGRVLLSGGYDGLRVLDDLWSWDGSAWEDVSVEGDGPGPRSHHGLAPGPDGVLLFGGATTTSTFASLEDDTWLLADGRWSRVQGEGPSARGLPALGYDRGRDRFILFGGFDADGAPLADTWEWDGSWRCVSGC